MQPIMTIKGKEYAAVNIPGTTFTLEVFITKPSRRVFLSKFSIPDMNLTKPQARAFVQGCEMLINYVEKTTKNETNGDGGGRTPTEFNDGRQWFWADRQGSYKVSMDTKFIYVPQHEGGMSMLRRISKLVGSAISFNIWKIVVARLRNRQ